MRKLLLALTVAAALLPVVASAADWQPNRPVEFVVASGAGGGTDIFARTVQSIITKYNLMPQPIVVLNKGGGSGAEGFVYVKSATGDPHKMVFGTNNEWMLPHGGEGRLEVRRAEPRRRHGLRRVPALGAPQRPLEDGERVRRRRQEAARRHPDGRQPVERHRSDSSRASSRRPPASS